MEQCPVCCMQRGEVPVPGGVVWEDEHFRVRHVEPAGESAYAGHLIVEAGRHVTSLGELTEVEAPSLGRALRLCDVALRESEGAEHVYVLLLGDHVPHLHLHVAPRYPGTPREYWGVRVDEWPQAPRVNEVEVEAVCTRLRAAMRTL